MEASVDTQEVETKVRDMYRHVAEEPHGNYHFELGRPLAERLGYPADILDRIPEGAIESFAGVGYFFDLAELRESESVVDLDPQIANRALNLRVAQQNLNRSKISRLFVDQGCLGPTE